MLGFIKGKIISRNPETLQCVCLVHRMGFEVTLPRRIFESIADGQLVSFWLHTHVREDVLALYGFETETERQIFRQLLNVSGFGPKASLALIGEHGSERLVRLIANKSASEIATAPGVGKKLAERLVLELAGKVEKWVWVEMAKDFHKEKKPVEASPRQQLRDDLNSALLNLGYQPNQIKNTLEKFLDVSDEDLPPFELCLKTALREMSNRHG